MSSKFTPELWYTATEAEQFEGDREVPVAAYKALFAQVQLDDAAPGARVLDVGTGLGVALDLIAESAQTDIHITGGDIEESFLAVLKEQAADQRWEGKLEVGKMDIMNLPYGDNHFDYIFSNFVILLLPKPIDGLRECIRALKPGGTLGFTNWAHSGLFYMLQIATSLIPSFPNMRTPEMSAKMVATGYWHDVNWTREQVDSLGLVDVKAEPLLWVHEAASAHEFAVMMWPLVKMVSGALGGGEKSRIGGWEIFEKLEKVVKLQFGDGPIKIPSTAVILTANKPL